MSDVATLLGAMVAEQLRALPIDLMRQADAAWRAGAAQVIRPDPDGTVRVYVGGVLVFTTTVRDLVDLTRPPARA